MSTQAANTLPPIEDFEDASFNPFAMEVKSFGDVLDPYSVFEKMRETGDVHPTGIFELFTGKPMEILEGRPCYMILGYDACSRAFLDPDTFNNAANLLSIGKTFGHTLSVMDAPEHPYFRRIFQKAFLPHTVTRWGQSVVQPVVDALISKFEHRGKADLVEDFTHHFPFQIIYRQLNLDDRSAAIFHRLAVAQNLKSLEERSKMYEASGKLGAFFGELVRMRAEDPGDDLVSHLALAEVDGERLPPDVLISFLRQLINAGGDTTYRGASNLLVGLLSNPDQLQALREDRGLVPQAIEEALRWEGPVTAMMRGASREVTIDGVTIPKDACVDVVLMSGNRDRDKFPDPHRFDIFRERGNRPIPFSTGPHVCIGQHLARLEITRAINALLDRLPNLRLDPDMPPPEIRGHQLRCPAHIHVLFD